MDQTDITDFLLGAGACGQQAPPPSPPAPERPNFLLIVADDMGYTDIGAYGGEIRTPHLDGLAARSVKFTNFHVLPTCAPPGPRCSPARTTIPPV